MIKKILPFSIFCLILGATGYLIYTEKMIILFPKNESFLLKNDSLENKEISLFKWNQNNTYSIEKMNLLPSKSESYNIHQIISHWVRIYNSQNKNESSLQKNTISSDGKILFLHFSHSPFYKNFSTYKKLSWIQGLFKTIHEYNKKITSVYFFIENNPLQDYELDFSHAWDIEGYLQ